MQLNILFDKIKEKATADDDFRDRLISAADSSKNSIVSFCKECNAVGIEIYPMDIADADESTYAAMRRSTNGGGENSPHLMWEEDIFGSFVEELRRIRD